MFKKQYWPYLNIKYLGKSNYVLLNFNVLKIII